MSHYADADVRKTMAMEAKTPQAFSVLMAGGMNLLLVFIASLFCWHVFFSPIGPIRLYTPNLGLALVISILMVIHWMVDAFSLWPFSERFLREASPLRKGMTLSAFAAVIGACILFVFYYNVLGRFGPVFFSGPMLAKTGGLGQFALTAQENACFAQIVMNTCIIFCTVLWSAVAGFSPWERAGRGGRGLGIWAMGMVLAVVAFSVLFYPHIAYQFYPAQLFMAVEPWWTESAMTMSSAFHFGWIVPALVLLYWTQLLWEGLPWSLIPNRLIRGVVMTVAVIGLGIAIMYGTNAVMDWYWDMEAFQGGATLENPAWRWNHVAEMAMFMHAAAVILALYFNNGPHFGNAWVRIVFRTVVAIVGGCAIAWIYYAVGPLFLGTVPGMGQEGDTSLCWTVMFLILMTMHQGFFEGYPFRKASR